MKMKLMIGAVVAMWAMALARPALALPAAQITPDPLEFPSTRAGTDSQTQSFTVTNIGTGSIPLCVFSVRIGDPDAFIIDSNLCTSKCLSVGQSCTIALHFHPEEAGHYATTMMLIDLSSEIIDSAGIAGDGVAPAVTLYPASIAFGDSEIGGPVEYREAILTNSGSDTLNITSVSADEPFNVSDDCGEALAASATCTLTIGFQPTEAIAYSGNVTIADDAAGAPQTIPLTGTGIPMGSVDVGFSPGALDFGGQQVGTTSASKTITVTSTGTSSTPLLITGIAVAGDFAELDGCLNTPLASGATCTISVNFTPSIAGARSGTITLVDNATDSPQTIALTGAGTEPGTPQASLSASSLAFGEVTVNTASAEQTVTLTNSGSSDLAIQITSIDGDSASSYSRHDTCRQQTLLPGQSCAVGVVFHPAATGALNATLSIADDAADSPQAVVLTGTGVAAATSSGGCSLLTEGRMHVRGAMALLASLVVLAALRICHRRRSSVQ